MTRAVEIGSKFGRLTVAEKLPKYHWRCDCDCGGSTIAYASHLRAGMRISCGCVRGAPRTHNMSSSPEYAAWDNAKSRCFRKKDRKYPLYGGRGITMCEEWKNSFQEFYKYMGPRPSADHSLDRFPNPNGNYEPGNCRWATIEEQNNNRSINRRLMIGGLCFTVAQASRLTGIPHATILGRLDAGKTDEEAVSCG